jgi:hypothetical protein
VELEAILWLEEISNHHRYAMLLISGISSFLTTLFGLIWEAYLLCTILSPWFPTIDPNLRHKWSFCLLFVFIIGKAGWDGCTKNKQDPGLLDVAAAAIARR